jgi:osmotically-inducible protein OsmY
VSVVTEEPPFDAQPEYVAEHVREAIAQDERLAELHVHVQVMGSRVTLTGEVATEERRRALLDVVSSLLPDCEVVNHTTVAPLAAGPKVERLS